MELEIALEIFEEIMNSCYNIDNKKFHTIADAIYREVINSKDVSAIVILAEELQVNIDEMDLDEDGEEEIIQEIKENIEKLSE